jgi:hypothetical protein
MSRVYPPTWIHLKHYKFVQLVLCLALCYLSSSANAQSFTPDDTTVLRISKEILNLITQNLDEGVSETEPQSIEEIDTIFRMSHPTLDLQHREMVYDFEIKQLKKDLGINFNSSYYFNYDPILDEDETNDPFTNHRARIGVDWEIFRNGLIGNKINISKKEREKQIELLENRLRVNDDRLYYRYNLIIMFFNQAKIKLLERRLAMLENQLELLYQVYYLKGILYEEIINLRADMERARVKIANYKKYNDWIYSILGIYFPKIEQDVNRWPALDVDLDLLIQDTTRQHIIDSIDVLSAEVESLKENSGNKLSLRLQFFESLGGLENGLFDASFTTVGARLSIPSEVIFGKKAREELAIVKAKQREQFNHYEHLNKRTEILNYYYEYKYKQEQFVEFMHKIFLYREKIRMEVIEQEHYLDIYRSLKILRYMDVMRQIQTELLDLKQQMYLLLLKIHGKTYYDGIVPFVKEIDVAEFFERLPAKRTLVLEEKALQQHDKYFIKNYLLSNDFEQVIIESRGFRSLTQINALRKAIRPKGIKVYKSVNFTQLITTADDGVNYFRQLLTSDYDGILVDMSMVNTPQRVESARRWLANFNILKNQLQAAGYADAPIALRLPLDFPYLAMAKEASLVILRLEKNQQVGMLSSVLKRKILQPSQTAIAFDASRFKDRVELEMFIERMINQHQIENVTIEGLSDFIALDTRAFIKSE